jgi:geranylgeranyl reductase family protein
MTTAARVTHADAVVIGAGPGGSAAAAFLAEAGHDVVLIEKDTFPRDKVCGDGLTPRAVKAMQLLGLESEAEGRLPGWDRQSGLRMYGGGVVLDMPWPQLADFPAHSVTATRSLFDHTLARNAVKQGAQLWEETDVIAPVYLTESQQRVAGVQYRRSEAAGGEEGVVRAPIVVVADGGSSRFAVQLGLHRDDRRPMGVAVRTYYRSPRSTMGMMEGFLDLYRRSSDDGEGPALTQPSGSASELLPGYGWIFPLDGGLVNVGWGLISTSEHFRTTNYRRTLEQWVAGLPPEWELRPDTMEGRPRSAGLPMGHNRRPPVYRGAMLIGDAAGMVNPFNGEGISYAIEAAEFAARAADDALARRSDAPLESYRRAVAQAWGGYYRLGHVFLRAMGHPEVMRFCTVYGMPHRRLMDFVFRTMAHLTNRSSRDATDLLINTLSRAVPAA